MVAVGMRVSVTRDAFGGADGLRFDPEIAEFISGAVMMVIGTRNRANMPDVGRGVGCRVLPDGETIEVLISAWQWPDTVANIRQTGDAAFTFVRPADYRSLQMKGPTSLRDCMPNDLALAERYVGSVTAALGEQGVPSSMTAVWLSGRDVAVATMDVRSLSIKTPGREAGALIGETP